MLTNKKLRTKAARQLATIPNNKIVDLIKEKSDTRGKKILEVKEYYTS